MAIAVVPDGEGGRAMNELIDWFRETPDIAPVMLQHIRLSYFPVVAAILVATPVGMYIGHARRFEMLAVTVANLGRAIPSFAILSLALPIALRLGLGLGFWPAFVPLFFLAIPPIVTNTYIGIRGVEPDTVEAARGMGLAGMQVLWRVELPLAAPLVITGVRLAAVQSVATATLAAFVGGGGLGDYIRLGIRARDEGFLWGGAILVALLAVVTELVFAGIQRVATPRGRTPSAGSRVEPVDEHTLALARTPQPAVGPPL
jgi:osmoprotectant transport system permease protein